MLGGSRWGGWEAAVKFRGGEGYGAGPALPTGSPQGCESWGPRITSIGFQGTTAPMLQPQQIDLGDPE